jgi:hypothetical protein
MLAYINSIFISKFASFILRIFPQCCDCRLALPPIEMRALRTAYPETEADGSQAAKLETIHKGLFI